MFVRGLWFEVPVGVVLYKDIEDVRWLYLGLRCVAYGLVGCYGDWKNEYSDHRKFLATVWVERAERRAAATRAGYGSWEGADLGACT